MASHSGEDFSSSYRLSRAEDFRQVFKNNIRISDDSITLLIGKRAGVNPRLGFAIAKKQIKRAVDRNRIKRLIRESFRRQRADLPQRDMVAMVRANILQLDHQQIFMRLDKHWRKAIIKCENY